MKGFDHEAYEEMGGTTVLIGVGNSDKSQEFLDLGSQERWSQESVTSESRVGDLSFSGARNLRVPGSGTLNSYRPWAQIFNGLRAPAASPPDDKYQMYGHFMDWIFFY